jgi:hypothetical protein
MGQFGQSKLQPGRLGWVSSDRFPKYDGGIVSRLQLERLSAVSCVICSISSGREYDGGIVSRLQLERLSAVSCVICSISSGREFEKFNMTISIMCF